MDTVDLGDLRRRALDLVRRVEAGEEITISVAGRPSARLVPIGPKAWRTYDEVADVLGVADDPDWPRDRDRIDNNSA
jgi:prevent-host-death family protein